MRFRRFVPVALLLSVGAIDAGPADAVPTGASPAVAAPRCSAAPCALDRLGGANGKAALDRLGPDLAGVAAAHGWTTDRLRSEFQRDDSLRVDPQRRLYYAEEAAPATVATGTDPFPIDPVPDVFDLHSRPGAPLVVYLDVDGHTTAGTYWNNSFGTTIVSAPFDLDGAPLTFSPTERDRIQRWWLQVAEDFAPWGVDVTTQDPGVEALRKTTTTDTAYGVRVVISPTNFYGSAGGVAYVGSFIYSTDTPTFVFTAQLSNGGEKATAEAISHETGHTLGLSHDGTSTTGYYGGQGSWAPIMGVGYYKSLTQWSRGSYPDANNTEDDLAVIGAKLPPRIDDIGDTTAAGLVVPVDFTAAGTISTRTDADVFAVDAAAGTLSATVGLGISPDLDPQLRLLDASGNLLAVADPDGAAAATISRAVPAGRYYWQVDGVGYGDAATGYDDYASIGRYQITGALAVDPTAVTTTTVAATTTAPTTTTTVTSTTTAPVTVGVTSLRVRAGSSRGTAVADVAVMTAGGSPVTGATVTGTWSGQAHGTGTAITGANGVGTTASTKVKRAGNVTFTITAVSLPAGSGYTWNGLKTSATTRL